MALAVPDPVARIELGIGILIMAIDLSVVTLFALDWWRGDTSHWRSPDDEVES